MVSSGIIGRMISRFRHSRGFGVHSPFAFRMVHDVIRPRYEYYREEELQTLAKDSCLRKVCGLLFRLTARLGFRQAMVASDAPAAVRKALEMARGDIEISTSLPKGKSIIFLPHSKLGEVDACAREGNVVVCVRPSGEDIRKICEGRRSGLLLYSSAAAILFARSEMAFVAYDIRL